MQPRTWKLLGIAGLAGVTATGVVVARRRRAQEEYDPDELRAKLHARLAEVPRGGPAAAEEAERPAPPGAADASGAADRPAPPGAADEPDRPAPPGAADEPDRPAPPGAAGGSAQ